MIKKCPCCGSEVKVMEKDFFETLVAKNGSACLTIECENTHSCGLSMYCHYESKDYEVMKAVAIDRWNQRAANE